MPARDDQSIDFTLDTASELATIEHGPIEGKSPWTLAWRRLRRNYVALAALGIFLLVVVVCCLAPVYAHDIAHSGPNSVHLGGTITIHGRQVPVVSVGSISTVKGVVHFHPGGAPLGPQWGAAGGRYILGGDQLGRDTAVRLLYGGLNSLRVGILSAAICILIAVVLALVAGFYRGWIDWLISRFFDLVWAFPAILLAIALGAALSLNGIHWGPIHVSGGNIWIPTFVIAFVTVPYVGRPLRGQILSLREKEFVEAARGQGASNFRIMFREILPNIASTVLVLFTLIVAGNILIEAGLSFLGAGVQPPNPSWGNLISDGEDRIQTAPWLAVVPGIAIVITAVSLNIFGDGLRDALDPRAKVRVGR
jgi:peptide/nickel transport system permease protein